MLLWLLLLLLSSSRGRLLRMHTAVQLNRTIRTKSTEAQIVIVNFPEPPAKQLAQENCMFTSLTIVTDIWNVSELEVF